MSPTAAAGALAFSNQNVDLDLPTIRRQYTELEGMVQSPYNKLLQT